MIAQYIAVYTLGALTTGAAMAIGAKAWEALGVILSLAVVIVALTAVSA